VSFEAINVEQTPAALEDLKHLGVRSLPAVTLADRAFHGWNPKELAAFVGVTYVEPEHLSPTDLLERLDRILAASQRAIMQVPGDRLEMAHPERKRTVRSLGYHLFRISLAFCDTVEQKRVAQAWATEEAPQELNSREAIAEYGEKVRNRLQKVNRSDGWDDNVTTIYGSQTVHQYLERTVWHAAQHLRQLYSLLEMIEITPIHPLGDADFKGLPLPREVW
jgi:hypothetical protein